MINSKKGDSVIVKGFTGIKLGVFEVTNATKKTVSVTKKNGEEMIFDRKTGKQVNVVEGKEKYANSIIEDDGSYVAPTRTGSKNKKSTKKATKQAAPVEEDEEDEEEEAPAPKKAPKGNKKPAKKPTPVVEEDDEDDDEFEEIDDED